MTLTTNQRSDLLAELSATFPDLNFRHEAFDTLFAIKDHGVWRGKEARAWLRSLNKRNPVVAANEGDFHPEKLDRLALREYCCRHDVSDIESFVAVMAWGAMSTRNGRHALDPLGVTRKTILRLIRETRHSAADRAGDYERFYKARVDGLLKGIGPAYYTKLLFFLRPDQQSYILDQWTAKSMHVLTGSIAFPIVVKLPNDQARVSDAVTPEQYEKYCRIIDIVADHSGCLNWTGSKVEERLFSQGGRDAKPWRAYVRQHWPTLRP